MNQYDFFHSEIYGAHWGMLYMPTTPRDEPEVARAKKKFEMFPWPKIRLDV